VKVSKANAEDPFLGFVLAAGEGRRLRPATLMKPKATVPFCGVPLVSLAVDKLGFAGAVEVVVNSFYMSERIEEELAKLRALLSFPLLVSRDDRLLYTGGGQM